MHRSRLPRPAAHQLTEEVDLVFDILLGSRVMLLCVWVEVFCGERLFLLDEGREVRNRRAQLAIGAPLFGLLALN